MKVSYLEFLGIVENCRTYKCPLCGGLVKVPENVFYGRCDTCLCTVLDYIPEDHQKQFHESKATFRLNVGGYGSGKTTQDVCEVALHAMSIPNGKFLITAQTLSQVKEAVLPELEKFLPPWFVEKRYTTPLPKYRLINGHEILIYPSDDEEKLRSLNLTGFLMVEASGMSINIFNQLVARTRNSAAVVKDAMGLQIDQKFMGIIESNPEDCWWRDEFLLRSEFIGASKSVDISSYKKLQVQKPNRAYHSFLSSSADNKYLHRDFINNLCVGKSEKWIRKYVYCFLESKEGTVFPDFVDCVVDPFPIPKHWKRVFGFDKGFADATCLVCGAIDPQEGICYIYDEYYELEKPISYHANRIKEKIIGKPLYRGVQADPTVRNRNERDGQSYKDYFFNVSGIVLEEGNNNIMDGIEKMRDFMFTKKLKFFTNCVNIREEAQKYVWKRKDGLSVDKPVDNMNHTMDACRYLIMCLPFNLREVGLADNFSSNTEKFLASDEDEFSNENTVFGMETFKYE